jgi:hypothetical protein
MSKEKTGKSKKKMNRYNADDARKELSRLKGLHQTNSDHYMRLEARAKDLGVFLG